MKRLDVPVQFTGVVTVLVPEHLSADDGRLLAGKFALARILATCDNPDASEDHASADYADERSAAAQARAEEDWDRCQIQGVGGQWSVSP
jgi:hypothetical protein